jgi:hypothetical protein
VKEKIQLAGLWLIPLLYGALVFLFHESTIERKQQIGIYETFSVAQDLFILPLSLFPVLIIASVLSGPSIVFKNTFGVALGFVMSYGSGMCAVAIIMDKVGAFS